MGEQQYMDLVDSHKKVINDLISLGEYFGQKKDDKLVYMDILLAFSNSLKMKHEQINEIEIRQSKALQKALKRKQDQNRKKDLKLKPTSKSNPNPKKRGNKRNKDKNKNKQNSNREIPESKLIALYHQQREMDRLNRSLTMDLSLSPRSDTLSSPKMDRLS